MKILHTGDWHARAADLDEFQSCIQVTINEAARQKVDFIVIAGDITDMRDVRFDSAVAEAVMWAINELGDIAPLIICGGTPYHEGNLSEKLRFVRAANMISITTKAPSTLAVGDTLFSVVPQPTKRFINQQTTMQDTDKAIEDGMGLIFARFASAAKDFLNHVFVGHFTVGGAYISETQQMIGRDIEISKTQLQLANAGLYCLGHIHMQQQIGKNIFYCGSLYSLTAGELQDKGFYIHTMENGNLVESEFIKTPSRPRVVIDLDFASEEKDHFSGEDEFKYMLMGLSGDIVPGCKLHIRPRIWADEAEACTIEMVQRVLSDLNLEPHNLKLEITRVPRQNVRSQHILEVSSLRFKVFEMAQVKGESVSEEILNKADALESQPAERILEEVRSL